MKKLKKMISIVLSAVISCIVAISTVASAQAISANNVNDDMSVGADGMDDISISSTNSVGDMLTSVFEAEKEEQAENNGINIFSVEVVEKTAVVEFQTTQDAEVIVAIYDESAVEMIASGATTVTSEDKIAEVTIDVETMPEYFFLKAFVVDSESSRPLCTVYESPNYTKEMQEFFAKTTDDFDEEKVLNFDDDTKNNFAVYNDETVLISSESSENEIVSVDDENKVYVIEDANEDILSLSAGDIFAYNYSDENILVVKVKDISINGTTATIHGDEVELEEVFDYIKIDETCDTSTVEYDDSSCDEGITYKGLVTEEEKGKTPTPVSSNLEIESSTSYSFEMDKEIDGVKLNGSLELGVAFSAKVYLTWSYQYVELNLDYSVKVAAFIGGEIELFSIPLGFFVMAPVPGVTIEFTPSFVIEGTVKVELSGTLTGGVGLKATLDEGIQNTSKNPEFKTEFKVEGTLFIGISLKPEINILYKVIEASMTAKVGAEIQASVSVAIEGDFDKGVKKLHQCISCIGGTISGKAELSFEIQFFDNEDWKLKINALTITRKICDFYYSQTNCEFGFTSCPNYVYKVTIRAEDSDGNPVRDAKINDMHKTDKNGKVVVYLSSGDYNIVANHDDVGTAKTSITVEEEPVTTTLVLRRTSGGRYFGENSDNIFDLSSSGHSAYITENGDLYMWGGNKYGQLGNGNTTNSTIPKKIMSNVKSVSLGDDHSAAITEDGDLYVWGYNRWGQIGDGTNVNKYTPVKIMSNVKSVSLGYLHSAAITKDGDLYTWGTNSNGQLGNGITDWNERRFNVPQKIMSSVKTVDLGGNFSAAITEDGALYTWGINSTGQLGNGTTANSDKPIKIMSDVKSIRLGNSHAAAITESDEMYMWGYNEHGELGNGTTINSSVPIKVMDNVKSVSLGSHTSGAVTENGDLYVWGWNYEGHLGVKGDTKSPIKIMSDVEIVRLGGLHNGAINKSGELYMWGYNFSGQLGNGTTVDSDKPIKITIPATDKTPIPVSANIEYKTKEFTNLLPNELYNFYSMKTQNVESPFDSENLLYITQVMTDENGSLSVTYIPDEEYENSECFVVPFKQTDLSPIEVTMDELTYNGDIQYINPEVTFNGETLSIGKDYYLSGDYFADKPGEYCVTVVGKGLYTGKYKYTYNVSYQSGDVNCDGTVDVNDVTTFQMYIANYEIEVNESGLDINHDKMVDINDVTILQMLLAGYKI